MVASRCSKAPRRPDFASHPSEEELITSFLCPRVVSSDKSWKFIRKADVYAAGPADLTGGFEPALASNGDEAWYFFSTVRAKGSDGQRKARTVDSGEGCWHSEAGSKTVVGCGRRLLGHRQSFSFVTKEGGRRVRSGWLMVELGLDDCQEELALCKVYFSPRANKKPGATSSGRKRKAADASAPVRQRRRAHLTSEADDPVEELVEKDPMADEEDQDESCFSWWLRNKSRLMAELGIDEAEADEEDEDESSFSWWLRNKSRLMAEGIDEAEADEEDEDESSFSWWLPSWLMAELGIDEAEADEEAEDESSFSWWLPSWLMAELGIDEAEADEEDEDESSFSWWLRNKSRLMAELGIDETEADEEAEDESSFSWWLPSWLMAELGIDEAEADEEAEDESSFSWWLRNKSRLMAELGIDEAEADEEAEDESSFSWWLPSWLMAELGIDEAEADEEDEDESSFSWWLRNKSRLMVELGIDEAEADEEDEDESSFSWWLRNKSRLMAELGIDEADFEHIRVQVPDVPQPPPPSSAVRDEDYRRWLPMEDILELPESKAWFQQAADLFWSSFGIPLGV